MTQCDHDNAPLEEEEQIRALAALAQTTRLKAFRLLSQAGDDGMVAGSISRDLSVPHNTLSTHLAILNRAGLIGHVKEGRNIRYFLHRDKVSTLASFLLNDLQEPDECSQRQETASGLSVSRTKA